MTISDTKTRLKPYVPKNSALATDSVALCVHALFCIALFVDVVLLCFMISEISIYSKEASNFFLNATLPDHIANLGVWAVQYLFHNPMLNDYGLRLPFVCLHAINCVLLYGTALHVLHKPKDALLCCILFMTLPGVSVQALMVSYMGVLTFLCLLIVYIQVRYKRIAYELFLVAIFLDSGSAILYLALFFYALLKRKTYTIVFSIVCFGINMYKFAPIYGVPHSYFLDTLGLMSLVFTPVFFVHYVAATYSYTFKKEPLLLHLIPFVGFLFILLLSTRQKIEVESFLPPLCVGIPFFTQKILFDVRSRLPQFRTRYKFRIYGLVLLLFLGNVMLFGNKLTYYVSDVKHNFAYSFYEAKEVARVLHKRNITHIYIPYKDLALRLRFYGINAESKDSGKIKYALKASPYGQIKLVYGRMKVAQYAIVPFSH